MSKQRNTEYKSNVLKPESEDIEYKEKLTDSLEKEVVAFLNANGGCIYIGIKNNGEIIGVQDIDKIQLQIKDRLIFGVSPSTLSLISISAESFEHKTAVKVTIKEGTEKPYYIKNKGLSESGAFIRVGSYAQPMTQKMIHAYQRKSFPKSLINIESPEQDLTFAELFIHYLRYKKPLNNDTFAKTLNFLTKDGKYNYLAYMMADNNQLSVRFARFNDAGKRFELLEKAIEYGSCCLITAIQRVLDRYEIENITHSKLTGAAHRIDKRLVDAKCLREVVINAFAHNDYSYGMLPIFEVFQNRFAVRSYGGLVPQLSIDEFFQGVSNLRNAEFMRILKDLELVEALGFGIREITNIYNQDIFEFSENSLHITLPFGDGIEISREMSKGISRKASKGITTKSRGISKGITNKSKGIRNESRGITDESRGITNESKGIRNESRGITDESRGITNESKGITDESKGIRNESKGIRNESKGITDESRGITNESKGITNESKGIILGVIIKNPKISIPEIAKIVNLSLSGVEKNIRQLKKEGKLSRTTNTKSGEWIIIDI